MAGDPVIRPGEGRPFHALGSKVERLVHPKTVGSDQLGVSMCEMEPGDVVKLHSHDYEEAYYVVKGTGTMWLDGHDDVPLEPGVSVYISPNRVHGQVNDGDQDLHILCSLSPPPVEGDPPNFADVKEASE